MPTALILFAHGARDPAWAAPFEAIAARIRQASPGTVVRLAFLELMQPDLATVVAELAQANVLQARVVPVFMAAGSHLKRDLPQRISAAQQAHPAIHLTLTPPVGEDAQVQEAIAQVALAGL